MLWHEAVVAAEIRQTIRATSRHCIEISIHQNDRDEAVTRCVHVGVELHESKRVCMCVWTLVTVWCVCPSAARGRFEARRARLAAGVEPTPPKGGPLGGQQGARAADGPRLGSAHAARKCPGQQKIGLPDSDSHVIPTRRSQVLWPGLGWRRSAPEGTSTHGVQRAATVFYRLYCLNLLTAPPR